MTTRELLRFALQSSDEWTRSPAEDMRDAPLTQPTPRGGNHPMWVMGHLAHAEGAIRGMITGEPNPLEDWAEYFGQGTEPHLEADRYPPYEEVLARSAEAREATMRLLDELPEEELAAAPKHLPPGLPEMDWMKSTGHILNLIAMHRLSHCGQLTDARRAAGKTPLVA
jgi:uncharacterized damage-inducible protein DinB